MPSWDGDGRNCKSASSVLPKAMYNTFCLVIFVLAYSPPRPCVVLGTRVKPPQVTLGKVTFYSFQKAVQPTVHEDLNSSQVVETTRLGGGVTFYAYCFVDFVIKKVIKKVYLNPPIQVPVLFMASPFSLYFFCCRILCKLCCKMFASSSCFLSTLDLT